MSLSRFDMPSKYYVQHRSRLVGLYRDQLPQPVSMPWWPCPMLPSPGRATSRFILPWRSPPQSSFAHFSRSYLSMRALAYPGFRPSSRHHRGAFTGCEGCHALTTFRPQAFSASRRFAPLSGFASLFHPAATSRVVAVQGVLSSRSCPSSSKALAPLLLSSLVLESFPKKQLSRRSRLSSEAFIHARPRSLRFGVSLPVSRSPLRFSVSSRSSSTAFDSDYSESSAHDVASTAPPSPKEKLCCFSRLQRLAAAG